VIDGGGASHAVQIGPFENGGAVVQGFTIRNGDDAVTASGRLHLLNSRITASGDGVDLENGSGGLVHGCTLEGNRDDGIDLDGDVAVVIERNVIRNNGNDGIEVRLHDYSGPQLSVVVRGNLISGNGGDGIQLIDYQAPSSRVFRIERNLFLGNAMAAIGMMCCMNTVESFEGAALAERIYILDNSFVENDHGVAGGANVVALNNLFLGTTRIALKRVGGGSIAAYNLFFDNGTDLQDSNADAATTIAADPLLGSDYRPSPGSPAVDAGTAFFEWNSEVVLDRPAEHYRGLAPDLGAFEALSRHEVEDPATSGLGAEIPLLLGPLIWLARRRPLRRQRGP
jgi:hypothetical protein